MKILPLIALAALAAQAHAMTPLEAQVAFKIQAHQYLLDKGYRRDTANRMAEAAVTRARAEAAERLGAVAPDRLVCDTIALDMARALTEDLSWDESGELSPVRLTKIVTAYNDLAFQSCLKG